AALPWRAREAHPRPLCKGEGGFAVGMGSGAPAPPCQRARGQGPYTPPPGPPALLHLDGDPLPAHAAPVVVDDRPEELVARHGGRRELDRRVSELAGRGVVEERGAADAAGRRRVAAGGQVVVDPDLLVQRLAA